MHCHNRRLWRPIANSVPAAPLQACKPLLLRQRRLPGPSWLPTSPPDHSLNFKIGARTPGSPDIGETQPAEDDLAEDGLEGFSRQRPRFGDVPPLVLQRRPARPSVRPFNPWQPDSAAAHLIDRWQQLSNSISESWGRLLYLYFNWRQDTYKDLLLIVSLFSTFVVLVGSTRRWLIDSPDERNSATGFWNDIYQVCQWVFGQEFPKGDSSLAQQVFAVATAAMGLCVFAVVLALVEQVVLEGMEANVKRGSRVYETGHHLILGWCVSQRDLEVVRKIMQQICVAYRPEGGTQVVVMTQRSKLEMESMFWRSLPRSKRFGTQIIFRQGSVLVPTDLQMVGASRAAATVIVSDQSRSAAEADAQSVRCAILLDELDVADADINTFKAVNGSSASAKRGSAASAGVGADVDMVTGHGLDLTITGRQVVVELKTSNALPLLKYACSNRIIALPTNQLNAQRLAKMVKRPVISVVSQQLFNFENSVSTYVHFFPHLVGRCFGELAFLFPDGIIIGLVDRITGKARMAPSKDYILTSTQALVVIRPTIISSHSYHPLMRLPSMMQPLHGDSSIMQKWMDKQGKALYFDGQLAPVAAYQVAAATPGFSQVEAFKQHVEASNPYACGQVDQALASRDASAGYSLAGRHPKQNNVVAINVAGRTGEDSLVAASTAESASKLLTADSLLGLTGTGSALQSAAASEAGSPRSGPGETSADQQFFASDTNSSKAFMSRRSISLHDSKGSSRSKHSSNPNSKAVPDVLKTEDWPVLSGRSHKSCKDTSQSWHLPGLSDSSKQLLEYQQKYGLPGRPNAAVMAADMPSSLGVRNSVLGQVGSPTVQTAAAAAASQLLVPVEYLQVDEGPERVLVLEWGPNSLMTDLIKELDHGLSALPYGSEVVFANTHHPDDSLGMVLQNISLENIKVRHVYANPLQRSSLASKLDMSTFRCAVVLCDELWVDPDSNDTNGIEGIDEPSVLRQDALVMVTQLNVRKLLEDSRRPPINIICQKIATEGMTRFEDRNRLPLGISINFNSFSAKLLSQIAANPLMLYPVTRLGEDAQLTIVDSSAYAGLNENTNWWQLVARCQEVGDVLMGYYAIPDHMDEPLNTVVDPLGMEERCRLRVWNNGDGRFKFIVLRGHHSNPHSSSSGSVDDMELENTHPAHWVRQTPESSGGSTPASGGSQNGTEHTER